MKDKITKNSTKSDKGELLKAILCVLSIITLVIVFVVLYSSHGFVRVSNLYTTYIVPLLGSIAIIILFAKPVFTVLLDVLEEWLGWGTVVIFVLFILLMPLLLLVIFVLNSANIVKQVRLLTYRESK